MQLPREHCGPIFLQVQFLSLNKFTESTQTHKDFQSQVFFGMIGDLQKAKYSKGYIHWPFDKLNR